MNKTKTISLSIATLMAFGLLAGCNKNKPSTKSSSVPAPTSTSVIPQKIAVESVAVTSATLDIYKGNKATIEVTVLPENATDKSVTFSSSNTSVATVNGSGEVTAVNDGVAIITVASVDNPTKVAFKTVQVSTKVIKVTNISVSPASLSLVEEEQKTLTVTVSPEDATDKSLKFSSTKENVATVSTAGVVTAVAPGDATILVQSVDNPTILKQVPVSVTSSIVPVTGISLGTTGSIKLAPSGTLQLEATVTPSNATNKAVSWESDNESVAVVNSGYIEALSVGQTIISCTSVQNPSVKAQVIVNVEIPSVPVEGVVLEKESLSLNINDYETLNKSILPANASNKDVVWSSDKPNIAGVDGDGKVTGYAEGDAKITVKTVEGGFTAICDVHVSKIAVTEVKLDYTSISCTSNDIGKKYELNAEVLPANATFPEVFYMTSNESVATVSTAGEVQIIGLGTATITAIADGVSSQCEVKVEKIAVTEINLSEDSLELVVGGNETLTATVLPEDATYKTVTWDSTDKTVATVDTNGKVSALKAGSTVISASADGLTAYCAVTVYNESEYYYTLPVNPNNSYKTYLSNKAAKPGSPIDEFIDRSQNYKVGTDNAVNLRPIVQIYNKDDEPVDQSLWNFDYKFEVYKQVSAGIFEPAAQADYTIVNAKTCDIKFNQSSQGNIYKVVITLGHLDPEDVGDPETSYEYFVESMAGYNIYNVKELSYIDTTTASYIDRGAGDCDEYDANWRGFKAANGLSATLAPSAVILHSNMVITPSALPAEMFYTEADANAGGWSVAERNKSIGSLKDYTFIYCRTTGTELTFEGNYFMIDWRTMPLNARPFGEAESSDNKIDSHCCLFRTESGAISFRNLNLVGNSGNAKQDEDTKFAGGLMFAKAFGKTSTFELENTLSHQQYITVMSEQADNEKNKVVVLIDKCKMSNNYNSFLYNWGGTVYSTDSYFEGCGGPVIIQDHIGLGNNADPDNPEPSDPPYSIDGDNNLVVNGLAPYTCFQNCDIRNYVLGEEAWFKSFHATPLVPTIKGLGDIGVGQFYSSTGSGKTFVMTQNHQGTTYTEQSAKSADTLFNFIVFNKWGGMQSLANVAVCGEVEFKDADGNTSDYFNYLDPNTGKASPQYIAARSVNGLGAPVLETRGGYTFVYNFGDSDHPNYAACNLDTIAGGGIPTPLSAAEATYFTAANEYVAIYYNGMMFVMSLASYVPGL